MNGQNLDYETVLTAVVAGLTTVCSRCNGKGTESWQRTSNPADGRENWPCVHCNGVGQAVDRDAAERVMESLVKHQIVSRGAS